jgi:hypothetical protein
MAIDWGVAASVCVAMVGWLYTARRQRRAWRKQHTFTCLLNTGFNDKYLKALVAVQPLTDDGLPVKIEHLEEDLRSEVRFILNHYEFIAAGIRNGDIDEILFRDSERGQVIRLFSVFESYIYDARRERNRDAIYEHFEWLYERWERQEQGWGQLIWEWVADRPCYGAHRKKMPLRRS